MKQKIPLSSKKICNFCNQSKSIADDFYAHPSGKDGHMSKCKLCVKEYSTKNRERIRQRTRLKEQEKRKLNPLHYVQQNLKSNYGISFEEKNRLWEAQERKCGNRACLKPLLLFGKKEEHNSIACVDHPHGTKIVRGLLCNDCNKAIGFVFDSPERLAGLIDYLRGQGL